ncbi:flagellar biosynthetic protein FliO [Acidovorax sp. Be4]|uniref:Flagellar biosynthetic protein FliO n=1 Tax=Acidovorax bellezanensis TaxID=2976702 RepID=A0ABT2PU17_9BURK|nr:flagellar biosynthetic protein FliO [Acidovorax sp. Be4]MCT9812633.1 flagellar biosynthetic protein FliO [Acidovorax sp. Be4]
MTQTLLAVLAFVAFVASLPWLLKRMQQRQAMARGGDVTTRVLSAVAVGAHQRVVTVEVGEGEHKTRLVLGVTAQQINCLHVLGSTAAAPLAVPNAPAAADVTTFTQAMAAAQTAGQGVSASKASHGE